MSAAVNMREGRPRRELLSPLYLMFTAAFMTAIVGTRDGFGAW